MISWMRPIYCFLLFAFLTIGPTALVPNYIDAESAIPQIESPVESQHLDNIKISLLPEENTIQSGHSFWIAIHINITENWHTYWKNPGDSGMATSVNWTLPEGFTASALQWPTPKQFNLEGVNGYGYEKELVLLSQITPPPSFTSEQPVNIIADVRWLVCSDSQCVPGETQTVTTMPIENKTPEINQQTAKIFTKARSSLPEKQPDAEAYHEKDTIQVYLQLPENLTGQPKNVYFFPEEKNVIDHKVNAELIPSIDFPDYYILVLKTASPSPSPVSTLKGVMVMKDSISDDLIAYAAEVDAPVIEGDSWSAEGIESNDFQGGIGLALLLAFAGGLLLNLMPCVLPVVSFKILSFVKMAGQNRALVFKHGLAFSFGVLFSFWVLAGLLLTLQASGQTVGWGFQLQEPLFVAFLAALLLMFGLSMFGVFELGAFGSNIAGKVRRKTGLTSSFLSGILATTVATPCTGPFLGSAVGFAFTVSAPAALLIFTFLGLGMAGPYLLLAAYPNLLRFVPKPGAWMDTFKQVVGFVMVATVLWLVWVFSAQTSSLGVVILLMGFFCITLAGWIYGKWGSPVNSRASRYISYALVLAALTAGGYAITTSVKPWIVKLDQSQSSSSVEVNAPRTDAWESFSPERVAYLRSQGTPVLIDFTAKWCLICQVNHLVLTSDTVDQRLNELGVVKMKADWTKNDPIITQELRKLGRNGVPLYVLYGIDSKHPVQILPQVLTPENVLEYLK